MKYCRSLCFLVLLLFYFSIDFELFCQENNIQDASNLRVYSIEEEMPKSAKVLVEKTYTGDLFSDKCSYQDQVEKAKSEALKRGANALKIIEFTPLTAISNDCHQITVDFLKISDTTIANEIVPDVDYALLYIYRPPLFDIISAATTYKVYLGDSMLCRVSNKTKQTFRIYTKGNVVLSAKTEDSAILPLHIQAGKEYFINCGLAQGIYVGRPLLQYFDKSKGISQYQNLKGNNPIDTILLKDGSKIKTEITFESPGFIYYYKKQKGKFIQMKIDRTIIQEIKYGQPFDLK